MTFDPKTESEKITRFIHTIFDQTGKTTAVIALSGGIDSAVSFTLTCQALGADHVHAFYLPSKTSNPQNFNDIQQLISSLQLPTFHLHIIPIGSIIQKSWRTINHPEKTGAARAFYETFQANRLNSEVKSMSDITNRLRLANLSARIRMMIIFDQAKKYDALVVGTENKSERMLGYFTRFGDAASDLEPITHLFKTQVIDLAKYLNIPTPILTKAPSADLWSGQTDEAELGFTYAEADPILMQIDQGKTPTGELADKIIAQVNQNNFKHHVPYAIPPVNLPLK